jgi:hypothetical protein
VVGEGGGRAQTPTLARSLGQCGSGAEKPVLVVGFGVRASVGRVATNASRFPPSDPAREAGARTDNALFAPPCSSSPSVALRRRVAARASMGEASLPATKTDGCGRETLIQSRGQCGVADCHKAGAQRIAHLVTPPRSSPLSVALRPRPALSPMSGASRPATQARAYGFDTLIQPALAVRLSKQVPGDGFWHALQSVERPTTAQGCRVRSGSRGERPNGERLFTPARSSPHSITPALCAAFADERRIIAGDEGGAQSTGGDNRVAGSASSVLAYALQLGRVAANELRFAPFDPVRKVGTNG